MTKPPEPGDIIWENLNLTKMQRFKRQVIATLLAAVLIIGTFFSILLLKWLQAEFLKKKSKEFEELGFDELTHD